MFIATYRGSVEQCVKKFVSNPRSSLDFPLRVSLECDLCQQTHSFNYESAMVVGSPTKVTQYYAHCTQTGTEGPVEVP